MALRLLQAKQRLLADMLQVKARGWKAAAVDKATWVAILRAAGMSEEAMDAWHREFEHRAPEAHHGFLLRIERDFCILGRRILFLGGHGGFGQPAFRDFRERGR